MISIRARKLRSVPAPVALCASAALCASVALGTSAAGGASAAQVAPPPPTLFEGARIVDGSGGAPIENGALLVQDGRVTAVGRRGAVTPPAGVVRVDVEGKTIMPALINVHAHMGYEGYTSWGAHNHTPQNLVDQLQREAYYGVAAATSVGSSPTEMSLQFQRDQRAGKFPPAAGYLFMPGMAPPHGGPDHILLEATDKLRVVNEVTTPDEARAAIRRMSEQQIGHLKMWVDDRRGTYPKLAPDVYNAIVQEAHARKIAVHAHAIQLADQKAVVAAGADVLVHMVQSEPIDEELQALLRQRQPVLGDGDRPGRSDRGLQGGPVLRGRVATLGRREDSRDDGAAAAGAELRSAVAERGESREDPGPQLPAYDRGRRQAGSRDRHGHSLRSHLRLRRARGTRALGAARAHAGTGDRGRDEDAGGADGARRSRHDRARQARRASSSSTATRWTTFATPGRSSMSISMA